MAGNGQPFANEDYGSFQEAMNRALRTPPAVLTAWAEALLARFSWAAVADRVVQGLLGAEAARTGKARP